MHANTFVQASENDSQGKDEKGTSCKLHDFLASNQLAVGKEMCEVS